MKWSSLRNVGLNMFLSPRSGNSLMWRRTSDFVWNFPCNLNWLICWMISSEIFSYIGYVLAMVSSAFFSSANTWSLFSLANKSNYNMWLFFNQYDMSTSIKYLKLNSSLLAGHVGWMGNGDERGLNFTHLSEWGWMGMNILVLSIHPHSSTFVGIRQEVLTKLKAWNVAVTQLRLIIEWIAHPIIRW